MSLSNHEPPSATRDTLVTEPAPVTTTSGAAGVAAATAYAGLAGPSGPTEATVNANLATVRQRIAAAGGDPALITVVAVTKGFGVAAINAAVAAGIADLGENFAQELLAKVDAAGPAVRWHFLGPVQRNKVAGLSRHVECWHTLDRASVGEAIARRQPGARVFVQVNATGEATKHGCRPNEAADLVGELRRLALDVAGLMAIGPTGAPELARPVFRLVADLARQLGLAELSMGMTDDLEVAIAEGATVVRIGRGLFGRRDRNFSPATVGS
jgi:pyridoxal phosphate enzyme (YggS family)